MRYIAYIATTVCRAAYMPYFLLLLRFVSTRQLVRTKSIFFFWSKLALDFCCKCVCMIFERFVVFFCLSSADSVFFSLVVPVSVCMLLCYFFSKVSFMTFLCCNSLKFFSLLLDSIRSPKNANKSLSSNAAIEIQLKRVTIAVVSICKYVCFFVVVRTAF